MPYSHEAYAMAVVAEIGRLERQVRHITQLRQRLQATLDARLPLMSQFYDSIHENIQELMEYETELQQYIQNRGLQLASLVSPFTWPIHVEAVEYRTWVYPWDLVLDEYDVYSRGA